MFYYVRSTNSYVFIIHTTPLLKTNNKQQTTTNLYMYFSMYSYVSIFNTMIVLILDTEPIFFVSIFDTKAIAYCACIRHKEGSS